MDHCFSDSFLVLKGLTKTYIHTALLIKNTFQDCLHRGGNRKKDQKTTSNDVEVRRYDGTLKKKGLENVFKGARRNGEVEIFSGNFRLWLKAEDQS